MSGESDLRKLLASLQPRLLAGEYIFCSFPDANYGDHRELQPFAAIEEPEGLTLVVPRALADRANMSYDAVFRGITLSAHSDLEAVGLTAALSGRLADRGLSANVIAGYFHDHIFVQSRFAEQAMAALAEFGH
jgi:hypothetical protein